MKEVLDEALKNHMTSFNIRYENEFGHVSKNKSRKEPNYSFVIAYIDGPNKKRR